MLPRYVGLNLRCLVNAARALLAYLAHIRMRSLKSLETPHGRPFVANSLALAGAGCSEARFTAGPARHPRSARRLRRLGEISPRRGSRKASIRSKFRREAQAAQIGTGEWFPPSTRLESRSKAPSSRKCRRQPAETQRAADPSANRAARTK